MCLTCLWEAIRYLITESSYIFILLIELPMPETEGCSTVVLTTGMSFAG